jgi:hypothetical protein
MASSWAFDRTVRVQPAFTNAVPVTIHDALTRSANRRNT